MMKVSIRQKLEKAAERWEEIGRMLADPEVIGRVDQFRELSMEYSRLMPTAESWHAYLQQEAELRAAEDLQQDADTGMRALGAEEAQRLGAELQLRTAELQKLLLPRDPRDGRNIYLEVRAGTGGDEA